MGKTIDVDGLAKKLFLSYEKGESQHQGARALLAGLEAACLAHPATGELAEALDVDFDDAVAAISAISFAALEGLGPDAPVPGDGRDAVDAVVYALDLWAESAS